MTRYKDTIAYFVSKYNLEVIELPENKAQGAKGTFRVLSGKYVGYTIEKTYDTIKRGNGISYRSLTLDSKKNYIDDLFSSIGYSVIEYPEAMSKEVMAKVICKQTGYIWETSVKNVEHGRRPRKDTLMSKGEALIEAILTYNDVVYSTEHKVVIEGQNLFYDFRLEDGSYIEFQGEQHFRPISFSSSMDADKAYKTQVHRDTLKRDHCAHSNIKLIEIIYPATTDNIYTQLREYLRLPKGKPSEDYISKYKASLRQVKAEVVAYYEQHSLEDTSIEYGLSRTTVLNYYKELKGRIKGRESVSNKQAELNEAKQLVYEEIDNYFITHTAIETGEKFDINPDSVRVGFTRRHGMSKRNYIKQKERR